MDKKLLALFRKLLALDEKALPDSISPEDFGKLIEASDGKLFIKPEDFKNLQKTLSDKDVNLKKLQEAVEKAQKDKDDKLSDSDKALVKMTETVKALEKSISDMSAVQETKTLAEKFPDILPELLIGKKPEEVQGIVDRQREVNKKLYGDSQQFAPPDYSSEADIDEAIEEVKGDGEKGGEESAVDVLGLGRQKQSLSKD